ncbi:MAG: helix-turn-helix transcriptional regulator [Candidatus Hodarchaeota archaeon]
MQNPQYLTEREVAEMTKRALPTLRNDRHKGKGMPYIKIGRSVRYALRDVIEYMDSKRIRPES